MPWRCHQTSSIPRATWLSWLADTPNPSPYLLPEWSLFWQDVWPQTRAEVWTRESAQGHILTAVPVVHRRRLGFSWRFAQPYGSTMGPLKSTDTHGLLEQLIKGSIVELTSTPPLASTPADWRRHDLTQHSWIIDAAGQTFDQLAQNFSGSHQRNLSKGAALELRVASPTDLQDVSKTISDWRDTRRAPRFMLHAKWGPALFSRFATTDSLLWCTAWAGERPVAGAVFLKYESQAVSIDTIVDRDPAYRGAGHWLVAECIRSLVDSGVTRIDLGGIPGGDAHQGLDEFKSGWGAYQETVTTTIYRRGWYDRVRKRLSH